MAKPRQYPLPDFGDVIFLLIMYMLLISMPEFLFGDGSTGWHLVTGHYILDTHTIPQRDLISYTFPGAPWVAYEWLFDLFAACLDKLGGLNALAVAMASMIALVFLLLYERCRKLGLGFPLAAFLLVAGALASSVHWLARPHVFTFLGVYVFSTALERFERKELSGLTLLVALSLCMAFWVNLHPGFLMGFALTVIYFTCAALSAIFLRTDSGGAEARVKTKWYGLCLGALTAASLLCPYGLRLFHYIADYLSGNQILSVTNEFESPVFHGAIQPTCLEIIMLFMLLGLVVTKKRPSLPQLLSSLAFAHLALSGVRNAPEFVIVALPFIADLWSEIKLQWITGGEEPASWLETIARRLHNFNLDFSQNEAACQMHLLPIAAVAFLFFVSFNSGSIFGQKVLNCGFSPYLMPGETLNCIRESKLPPNEGFSLDNWGGYIRYRLGIPVFIDDRADFYGRKFYRDYGTIVQLEPGWSELLAKNHINWILFPINGRITPQLEKDPGWKLICQDKAAKLFVRKN